MNDKQFVVNKLEILNEENEWKGEYWWAVVNTQRVEDCFECRNKEVALKLCDFLDKATDDFKWQIKQSEKWSAKVKQLNKENEQLRQTMQKVCELLEEEVDLFSDKATEHDVIAYCEMQDFDNKDAYYICTATKKAIQMLKGRDSDE